MYLTSFERMLVQDQIQVYKNRRKALLIDIDIYKMTINHLRDAIKCNDYKKYNVWKTFTYRSYKRVKETALQALKYMFVYARLV